MTLGLFAGTASARPGDRGPSYGYQHDRANDGRDNDGDGWVDEYDENTSYAVPDFDRQVRSGRMEFRQVKRFMRARMRMRIAEKTRMIHARFGYSRRAYRVIARMESNERARFQNRLAFMQQRFDHMRREARRDRYDRRAPRTRTGYVYNSGQTYVNW
ncbi:MAG: hypothetical protein CVU56_23725 [Deltaproteobacteria bacterium HGW-Deltaproteobacteria-14]|nr:MAG: hypothetical protein CVU56_23725 [Deltaproteobacteria bacterium HGW-Deltaproteobacteria-14]